MYVIAKVFENRPFNFQEDDDSPDCSRKTNIWKKAIGIQIKKFNNIIIPFIKIGNVFAVDLTS